jgi:hypothetical protein
VPDVHIHDLRRTLGSWLAASGYSLPLIGRALDHTQVSTTAIYARLNLDPVRQALERNAALMLSAGMPNLTSSDPPNPAEGPTETPVTLSTIAPSDTYSRGWFKLSREELYKKIWSQPAIALAQEFGISDRGLAKICAQFDIPVPARGYWQKLSAGQLVKKTPLPRLTTKVPSRIQIQRTPADTDAATERSA